MARREPDPYHWLAEYWDRVFGGITGTFDAPRERILGPILPRVASACDLACGVGRTALLLAGRGVETYGVDLSPWMLRRARETVRREGAKVRLLRADMRDFRLPKPVDLVLCEFDALNHVGRKTDLAKVARAVARALRPGGRFYFDVNNRIAFQEAWPATWWVEKPGVVMVMHGGSDPKRDRAWTGVEWFIQQGALWRRRHERVEEVCWSPAEIRATLRAAGFTSVRGWDAAPLVNNACGIRPGHRTFYLARKAAD
jgi:SAM-dependent methyltransferase